MPNKVCPICEGKKFIKVKEVNEMGFEYEIFKRCDCMKRKTKVEDENPFREEGRNNGITD